MRVCYIEIGKMPYIVGEPKCLDTALGRAYKIEDDAHQEEGEDIAAGNGFPASLHGHQEIGGAGSYRDEHATAKNNRKRLQPPWQRAENKMVCPYHGVEQNLRSNSQNAHGIRIIGFVQTRGKRRKN